MSIIFLNIIPCTNFFLFQLIIFPIEKCLHEFFFSNFLGVRIFFLSVSLSRYFLLPTLTPPPPPHHFSNGRPLTKVKAISDTVEHLVPRTLPARPRNSIWRQAKGVEFIFYIFYFCFLTFFFFLVGRTYILKCQVSYSLSEKRFYNRIFLKHRKILHEY